MAATTFTVLRRIEGEKGELLPSGEAQMTLEADRFVVGTLKLRYVDLASAPRLNGDTVECEVCLRDEAPVVLMLTPQDGPQAATLRAELLSCWRAATGQTQAADPDATTDYGLQTGEDTAHTIGRSGKLTTYIGGYGVPAKPVVTPVGKGARVLGANADETTVSVFWGDSVGLVKAGEGRPAAVKKLPSDLGTCSTACALDHSRSRAMAIAPSCVALVDPQSSGAPLLAVCREGGLHRGSALSAPATPDKYASLTRKGIAVARGVGRYSVFKLPQFERAPDVELVSNGWSTCERFILLRSRRDLHVVDISGSLDAPRVQQLQLPADAGSPAFAALLSAPGGQTLNVCVGDRRNVYLWSLDTADLGALAQPPAPALHSQRCSIIMPNVQDPGAPRVLYDMGDGMVQWERLYVKPAAADVDALCDQAANLNV